jgi:hypothetical protein
LSGVFFGLRFSWLLVAGAETGDYFWKIASIRQRMEYASPVFNPAEVFLE